MRYFVAVSSERPLWGNALVEAAAAECLVISNPSNLWNPFVGLPELYCSTVAGAIRLVAALERDEPRRSELLQKQRARLDWYCFSRPFAQIKAVQPRFPRPLKIFDKITVSEPSA